MLHNHAKVQVPWNTFPGFLIHIYFEDDLVCIVLVIFRFVHARNLYRMLDVDLRAASSASFRSELRRNHGDGSIVQRLPNASLSLRQLVLPNMFWRVYAYDWVGSTVICRRGLRVLVDADGNRSLLEPEKAFVEIEAKACHKQTGWFVHVYTPVDFVHARKICVMGYLGAKFAAFVTLRCLFSEYQFSFSLIEWNFCISFSHGWGALADSRLVTAMLRADTFTLWYHNPGLRQCPLSKSMNTLVHLAQQTITTFQTLSCKIMETHYSNGGQFSSSEDS
jgi:hypothetical protein